MNGTFLLHDVVFMVLTVVSHICASLFFAKPRFGKGATAAIWLIYAVDFVILPPDMPTHDFFTSMILHLVLFFVTTSGRLAEKGFLFCSYVCIYTFFSTAYSMFCHVAPGEAVKTVMAVVLLTLMQVILYTLLLPAFSKVAPYIRSGWAKYYAVVLSFFVLVVGQAMPAKAPMSGKESLILLFTGVAFCITYVSLFISMKNMAELSREKHKQIRTEFLQAQVDAQAKEAEAVRQNRHDMRHHYQMLFSLAKEGDVEKITDYLARQTESIEAMNTGRFCENETVNSILKVYQQKASAQDISMEIRAAAKPDISAAAPDLVTIIANILENALHGAAASGAGDPFIKVLIHHKSGRLVISCENSCDSSLKFAEIPEYLQGIGISSIITTADTYNGTCRFQASEGVFHSMVIMDQ